jgi:hypothetical protein
MNATPNNPIKLPDGPSDNLRRLTYALIWLPILLMVLVVLPDVQPIFDKLEKYDDLPELTAQVMSFVRMNNRAYCVPALSFVAGLLFLDARVVALLRQRRHSRFLVQCWFLAACCLSLGVLLLLVTRLFLELHTYI